MKNEITKRVINHLEFIGYEIEPEEDDDPNSEVDTFIASSESKSNIYCRIGKGVIYARAFWSGFDKAALKSREFYRILNELNRDALLTSFYIEEGKQSLNLISSALSFGYDRVGFTKFVETLDAETRDGLEKLREFAL